MLDLQKHLHHENLILPICARCRRIKTPKGYWIEDEHWFQIFFPTKLTPTTCPECMRQLIPAGKAESLAAEYPPGRG